MNLKSLLDVQFFPFVIRPARYIGNELGSVHKTTPDLFQVALAFPEKYDAAVSQLSYQREYFHLNDIENVACERVMAPDLDAEELHRAKQLPLFSIESFRPVSEFDLVLIAINNELQYANIVTLFELSGMPTRSLSRDNRSPLIGATVSRLSNVEPIADFFDFIIVGSAKRVVERLAQVSTSGTTKSKRDTLCELAEIEGTYVPSMFEPSNKDGKFSGMAKNPDGAKSKVKGYAFDQQDVVDGRRILPYEEGLHDSLSVELHEGVSAGTGVGYSGLTRAKERKGADVAREVLQGLAVTGYDEVNLHAGSLSIYRGIDQLAGALVDTTRESQVVVRFSRVHPDNKTLEQVKKMNGSDRPALSFEIQAGSERLRELLNCDFSIEQFYNTVANAFSSGWRAVKIYFLLGLPGETDKDIEEILEVARNVDEIRREYRSKASITVSLAPFIPRANTMWQWESQILPDEFNAKCENIRRKLKRFEVYVKSRSAEQCFVEGILSRGGRELAEVVLAAHRLGARFDNWNEHFSFEIWKMAFSECNMPPEEYLKRRELNEPLPWDHIEFGSSKDSFIKERELSIEASNRRQASTGSFTLGDVLVMKPEVAEQIMISTAEPQVSSGFGRKPKRVKGEAVAMVVPRSRVRLQWTKDENVRFVGHLATMKVFERAIRRAMIPVSYSQGSHVRQKLAFGPPLTLGYCSTAEYFDLQLETPFNHDIIKRLNLSLPVGFRVIQGKPVFGKTSSISSLINLACYSVPLPAGLACTKSMVDEILGRESVIITTKDDQIREFDTRRSIITLELRPENGVNVLYMELGMGNLGFVRPKEILLQCFAMPQESVLPLLVSRTNLLITNDSGRFSPLEVD